MFTDCVKRRLSDGRSLFLLGSVLFVTASLPAWADSRTDVLAGAVRCDAITDPHSWLDCYYGAAQPMRAQLGLPAASPAQVKLVPPAVPGAVAALPGPAPQAAVQPATVPSNERAMLSSLGGDEDYVPAQRLTAYSFEKGTSLFTVTLANGQVWKQIPQSNLFAHWSGPASNYTASVVPGMFNSHLMRVSDGHSYRVNKIK